MAWGSPADSPASPASIATDEIPGESLEPFLDPIVVFERTLEPNEQAFTFLKPLGWSTAGGIIRRDPLALGNTDVRPAAKLDFAVRRDSLGTAELHWLPNTVYCDISGTPMAGTELFPPGSSYQGMLVYPRRSAQEFLLKMMIDRLHPYATDFVLLDSRALPDLAQAYQQRVRALPVTTSFSYDAGTITYTYTENGTAYCERWVTVIEDWGEFGGGQWGNKETLYFRAPIGEFHRLEPVFSVILASLESRPEWISQELTTQEDRGEISLNTREDRVAADRQLVSHRRQTNAQIHAHVFFSMINQQEYINPFTGTLELGSNRWPHRWQDSVGTVIYCRSDDYNPNHDLDLPRHGFRRCEAILQTGSDRN